MDINWVLGIECNICLLSMEADLVPCSWVMDVNLGGSFLVM